MRGVEFWDIRYFISYTSFRDNVGAPLITNFCHWPQQIISISNSSSFYWLASNFRLEIIYHNHCQGHHHQHLNHHHNHQHACPSLSLCVYLEWSTENYQLTPQKLEAHYKSKWKLCPSSRGRPHFLCIQL